MKADVPGSKNKSTGSLLCITFSIPPPTKPICLSDQQPWIGYQSCQMASSQLLTLLHRKACHDSANIVQLSHIYEIAEISPQQQFEGHMTMSAVMTLWELLTKCQTINSSQIAVTSCQLTTHWLHQLTKMGVAMYAIIHPKFGQDHYTKSVS
jgi:hypothetical protein